MKGNWLLCTLILGGAALLARASVPGAPGPTFQFTSIDFPDATQAQGVNPGGEVVGLYVDSHGKQHGFLLSGGNFSSIDYPGAKRPTRGGLTLAETSLAHSPICREDRPIFAVFLERL